MATQSKNVNVIVEPTVVETQQPEVAVEPMVTVEQAPAVVEIPVPADFKGKVISVDTFAAEVVMGSKFFGSLEAALAKVIELHPNEALLVATPKDQPAERVYIVPENKPFLEAALASRPALRPLFKETVLNLVATYRASEEYQKLLEALKIAEENLFNIRDACWAATLEAAEPFDAAQFVMRHEYYETKPASETQATHAATTGVGRAARTSSKHQWSLDRYVSTWRNELFYLCRGSYEAADENGVARNWGYAVENGLGEVVSVGSSWADADKAWLRSTGRSDQVNTPGRWHVAEQEAAHAEGRVYEPK